MSWFDAAGFANIAKSALKEAQKTIDKALDIKEEGSAVPTNTQVVPSSTEFFETWNASPKDININKDIIFSPSREDKTITSIWGSFTGSFFENSGIDKDKSNSISLEDPVDASDENFSKSKLVVQHSEDGDDACDSQTEGTKELQVSLVLEEINLGNRENCTENQIDTIPSVQIPEKQESINTCVNRLSAISTGSGRTSSESADILTCSTECTTSPESEILSVGQSISTSSSALGPQETSDSVEVIGNSLTSPSSVEVISTNSTKSSRRSSQHTDEFVSPLQSPYIEEQCCPDEKVSPESVEVIPEDQEENSIEDTISYTSVSECTSATVLDSVPNSFLKQQKPLQDPSKRIDSFVENNPSEIASSPYVDAITRAPSRTTMHLPLTQVNKMLIDTQPQSTKQEIPNLLQKTNIIDIPSDSDNISSNSELDVSLDDGSQSDKTMISSDNVMESSSDTSTTETSSHSAYLKNMLADAMTEKSTETQESPKLTRSSSNATESLKSSSVECISISQIDLLPRENSPISSESRSDLVKIGSDHTSGHTSGDELETTTSSDIEIISSPNGDSSSTQSRQSPIKHNIKSKSDDSAIDSLLCKMAMKRVKGHTRELSEASSVSDDFPSEIDRLLKKMAEMTEILESRESKLIDVNRRNVELQELNSDLKLQLDSILTKHLESIDVSQVTEEYTQRLSALEKKFQQTLREKDNLRKELEQIKQEAATRVSNSEMTTLLSEKEEVIKELREEGEKLSKQQLQHSNIIKKLRAKEKENENIMKNLRESIEGLSTDADRLKKSLAAKEDVERTQIEAVHQLTNKNKKIENELVKVKGQLDDLTQKYDTTKKSLDAAKKELNEKHKFSSELSMREQMLEAIEKEKKLMEIQNEQMQSQLEDLRQKLRQTEEESGKKEEKYREERNKLMRKLEEAEARNEELSQLELEVSKPLVRQLESLQATHTMKTAAFEKIQEELLGKIRELNSRVQTYTSSERIAKEECFRLRSKLSEIENQHSSSNHKIEHLEMELEQQKTERLLLEQELNNKMDGLSDVVKKNEEAIVDKDKQISNLRHQLSSLQKLACEVETKQDENSQESNRPSEPEPTVVGRTSPQAGSNSPTLSLGKVSISDSFWSQDEPFDVNAAPRYTNMFEMQMLQTNLKQREGELQQLQWELNRREQERSLLNGEISTLITRVEELAGKTSEFDGLKAKFEELEKQYETLCQLYGEKVEENEELKLDLVDVKDMYRGQIDELLRQQKQNVK
ncbi:unnamed protein product [Phaedon cochleariae]|uniref:TATA element modulatory factor 1 TATA binding domain-containing protein n=1 Tax=Phaedon cochleariae TaxID=80249 RepID=A0A9N9SLQ6_PHACE|nr:unnamed protein product [Phaedon cochleariae]